MSICVVKGGMLDTIQDHSRDGYAYLGINPGGAMDRVAMQVANALVGNAPGTAVVEMHFPAADLLFEEAALVALAGADAEVRVNDIPVPTLHPVAIQKGAVLSIGKRKTGARLYLAVQGGLDIAPWLNSYSTHLKAVTGGYEGRRLLKGDRLTLAQPFRYAFQNKTVEVFPWSANVAELYSDELIHFVPGAQYGLLDEFSLEKLHTHPCRISRESDRMGYRLQTETLHLTQYKECISSAVVRGTIQMLPNGQLIILMADHQTTGGYPVIGYVAAADLSSLAQKQAGEFFRLKEIHLSSAENFIYQQQMNLQQLQNACTLRLQEYL